MESLPPPPDWDGGAVLKFEKRASEMEEGVDGELVMLWLGKVVENAEPGVGGRRFDALSGLVLGRKEGVERAAVGLSMRGVGLREMEGRRKPEFMSRCSAWRTRIQRCLQISSERRGPGSSWSSIPHGEGDLECECELVDAVGL
jgi:hypothetical protein